MLNKSRLLIVDDEQAFLEYVKLVLERAGFAIDVESDGLSALERFEPNPDLYAGVVTDYFMPNLNGFELASAIHAIRPNLPIVLISGFCSAIRNEEPGAQKFDEYVEKPFSSTAIVSAVKRALASPTVPRRAIHSDSG